MARPWHQHAACFYLLLLCRRGAARVPYAIWRFNERGVNDRCARSRSVRSVPRGRLLCRLYPLYTISRIPAPDVVRCRSVAFLLPAEHHTFALYFRELMASFRVSYYSSRARTDAHSGGAGVRPRTRYDDDALLACVVYGV